MRFSGHITFQGLPFAMTALAAVLLTAASAVLAADNVYFVQRQIGNIASPIGSSGAMSKLDVGPRRGAGNPKAPAQSSFSPTIDRVTRSDRAGGSLKELFQTAHTIRAVGVSSDGTRIVCHVVGIVAVAGQREGGMVMSQIVILLPSGTVERTIDLGNFDVKVFGTPVLLPDKKHVGVTVCKMPDQAALGKGLSTQQQQPPPGPRYAGPRPTGAHPTDPQSAREMLEQSVPGPMGQRTIGMGGGVFPNQPYVATIDLAGHELKQIAPGAMPCWSADGKTILFTSVTVPQPFADPAKPRLTVMNADGTAAHPVAAEMTWDGWFSGDGKRIAYIAAAGRSTQIMTANADGSDPAAVNLPPSVYASPRWLADGKTIAFATRSDAPANPNGYSGHAAALGAGPIRAVFTAGADGSAMHRVSPQITPNTTHGSGIDQDAELFLTRLTVGQPGASGPGAVAGTGSGRGANAGPGANAGTGTNVQSTTPIKESGESSTPQIAAVRTAFEDTVQRARRRLLASFDAAIAEAGRSAIGADGQSGTTTSTLLKEEKQRFEKQGLIPWSRPMWKAVGDYLDAVSAAGATVHAAVPAVEMPTGLRELVDKQIVAKWRHRPGNRLLVFYASGKFVEGTRQHSWSFNDGHLTYHWQDGFVTHCTIAADGQSYTGTNQQNRRVSGTYFNEDQ